MNGNRAVEGAGNLSGNSGRRFHVKIVVLFAQFGVTGRCRRRSGRPWRRGAHLTRKHLVPAAQQGQLLGNVFIVVLGSRGGMVTPIVLKTKATMTSGSPIKGHRGRLYLSARIPHPRQQGEVSLFFETFFSLFVNFFDFFSGLRKLGKS